jgi:hypothetical protein
MITHFKVVSIRATLNQEVRYDKKVMVGEVNFMTIRTRGIRTLVRRSQADRYLLLMIVSFAVSVVGTRLFLEWTGYPQLGNSELHIAHVLWGGVALYAAALLPLIFANRWVYSVSAILGGVGVGLFIDEAGKFVTQTNDYFHPLAAPIIYAVFLFTLLIYLQTRRAPVRDPRTEMYRVFDELKEVLDRDLDARERANLQMRLHYVSDRADDIDLAHLANALLDFLQSDTLHLVTDTPGFWTRWMNRLRSIEDRWFNQLRLKYFLGLFLGISGLVALMQLLLSILVLISPDLLEEWIFEVFRTQRQVQGINSLQWFLISLLLEGVAGVFLFFSGLFLLTGREQRGTRLGYWGLLLSLTTVNLLIFYFDQFETISLTLIQIGLLFLVLRYRQRYLFVGQNMIAPGETWE